jgi:hypothetical protein
MQVSKKAAIWRLFFITSRWSMKPMMRTFPWHRGQISGMDAGRTPEASKVCGVEG